MIALGTPVSYHHRAAVARHGKRSWQLPEASPYWQLFEGVGKDEYPLLGEPFSDLLADMFRGWPRRGRTNKTIMVWPEQGSGVITGRVKRGVGESVRGYASGGGYYDSPEYEQGYFTATSWFHLYVVRWALDGTGYILVPEWACAPLSWNGR